MTASVDDAIRILTETGHLSEEDLDRQAYRALLQQRPDLRIELAAERYKREEVTLNRAAEIAGISSGEMKRALEDRGIELHRGFIPDDEREERARNARPDD